MMSRGLTILDIVGLLSLILAACAVDEGVQSLNREHNVISIENVVGVQLTSVQDVNVRQVVGAATSIQVFTADNQQDSLAVGDRKSTRLNSSHVAISYAVFCLKKKKNV